jgi:predicted ATPase
MLKIDLHTHTLDSKKEGKTRNVTKEKYYEVLTQNNVRLAAITNHNTFDVDQYNDFCKYMEEEVEKGGRPLSILPGIEVDIQCNTTNDEGHLVLVTSRKNHTEFAELINKWFKDKKTNSKVDIETIIYDTRKFQMFYIGHFLKEHQNLSLDTMRYIENNVENKHCVFYEPSNLKKLGILTNHNYRGIIGSDVKDWNAYPAEKLPLLRIPIDSFEQLFLFSKRDQPLVNTLLNKKNKISLDLTIKGDKGKKVIGNDKAILYEDLNVVFGNKGTGKSKYLEAIDDALKNKGLSTKYYNTSSAEEELKSKLKTDSVKRSFKDLTTNEIDISVESINQWSELDPILLSKYIEHFTTREANKNRDYLMANFIKNPTQLKINHYKDEKEICTTIQIFITYLSKLDDSKFPASKKTVIEYLKNLLNHNLSLFKDRLLEYFSSKLAYDYVTIIKDKTEKKTNQIALPGSPRLYEFWENRKEVFIEFAKVHELLTSKSVQAEPILLGGLNDKINLYLREIHSPFDESKTRDDGFLMTLTNLKSLKKVWYKLYHDILDNSAIKTTLTELKDTIRDTKFNSLNDLIGVKREFFTEEHTTYEPSSGEAKMILLQEKLNEVANAYLLDEPDRSLGNVYVNSVILPKLLELANQKKIVVIVTHSANLAVRALPFCSILKDYDNKIYKTYIGSPFLDKMVNIEVHSEVKDWKHESIEILEGGKDAFLERGDTYDVGD